MYRKNVASQYLFFTLIVIATGAVDTAATVTVKVCIDNAAQITGAGTVTHMGSGQYKYAMPQAETNGNDISFLFSATGDFAVEKTIVTTAADPTNGVNFGLSALPNTAVTTNASLLTSGSGTDQLSVSAGKVLLQATQTGVTIPTVTTVGSVSGSVGSVTGSVGSVAGNVAGSVASVTGAVGSVTGNVGGNVVGSVASVAGNVSGNVVGSVGSVVGAVGSVTGSVASVTGAVGSVTGNVGGNVVGSVGSVVGAVGGSVASVTGAVGSVAGNVNGTVASVVDISTTPFAESAAVPAANAALRDKLNFMSVITRNKITQTATTQLVRNDTDTATVGTATVSDDGTTYIRGKLS